MTSSRFDRVYELIQTSLATLNARLSLPTITGGIFNDTSILSAQSALTGGGHVTKVSKRIEFTRHIRVDKWDMLDPFIFSWTESSDDWLAKLRRAAVWQKTLGKYSLRNGKSL